MTDAAEEMLVTMRELIDEVLKDHDCPNHRPTGSPTAGAPVRLRFRPASGQTAFRAAPLMRC